MKNFASLIFTLSFLVLKVNTSAQSSPFVLSEPHYKRIGSQVPSIGVLYSNIFYALYPRSTWYVGTVGSIEYVRPLEQNIGAFAGLSQRLTLGKSTHLVFRQGLGAYTELRFARRYADLSVSTQLQHRRFGLYVEPRLRTQILRENSELKLLITLRCSVAAGKSSFVNLEYGAPISFFQDTQEYSFSVSHYPGDQVVLELGTRVPSTPFFLPAAQTYLNVALFLRKRPLSSNPSI